MIPFCILSNLFCHCSEASADSAESFFKLFFSFFYGSLVLSLQRKLAKKHVLINESIYYIQVILQRVTPVTYDI